MKKITLLAILVAVIVIVLLGTRNRTTSVSIGAVLPLTGWGAYWATPVSHGIELATEDIQVTYGKDALSVVIEDSQSAPKFAASAASKLVSIDKVDAVYTEFSSLGLAASPIVQSADKVLLYSAMTPKILDLNTLSAKSFVNISTACSRYATYASQNNIRKIAVLSKIGDVAPACMESLKKTFDESNILLMDNIVGTDFKTLLLKTKQFGANAIIAIVVEADANALIKQKVDLGIITPLFCHKADCMTDKILSMYAQSLEGSVYFDSPVSEAFKERYTSKYGDTDAGLMEAAAFSYENVTALFSAEYNCHRDSSCTVDKLKNYTPAKEPALKGYRFENRSSVLDQDFYKITNGAAIKI